MVPAKQQTCAQCLPPTEPRAGKTRNEQETVKSFAQDVQEAEPSFQLIQWQAPAEPH